MLKTLEQVLKETGLTDEQIAGLDAKAKEGLGKYYAEANSNLEKAELTIRAQRDEYDKNIVPALNTWANEKAAYETKMAAYDAALKSAKEGGFTVPPILENPNPNPNPAPGTRGPDGKFVAGANSVPGSPAFVDVEKKLRDDLGGAFRFAADTQWKYRTLFGKEMPDAPTALIAEATAQRLDPFTYAAKKYGFQEREATIAKEARQKEIDAAVKDAEAKKDKEWSEKVGSNPDVRIAHESSFSAVSKAVQSGQRKDPLKLTPEERKVNTHAEIQKSISDRAQMVQ